MTTNFARLLGVQRHRIAILFDIMREHNANGTNIDDMTGMEFFRDTHKPGYKKKHSIVVFTRP